MGLALVFLVLVSVVLVLVVVGLVCVVRVLGHSGAWFWSWRVVLGLVLVRCDTCAVLVGLWAGPGQGCRGDVQAPPSLSPPS